MTIDTAIGAMKLAAKAAKSSSSGRLSSRRKTSPVEISLSGPTGTAPIRIIQAKKRIGETESSQRDRLSCCHCACTYAKALPGWMADV